MSKVCPLTTLAIPRILYYYFNLAICILPRLDLVGSFSKYTMQKRYLLVATDYFTKWIEVERLSQIKNVYIHNFLRKNIIYRFYVPWDITLTMVPSLNHGKLETCVRNYT